MISASTRTMAATLAQLRRLEDQIELSLRRAGAAGPETKASGARSADRTHELEAKKAVQQAQDMVRGQSLDVEA